MHSTIDSENVYKFPDKPARAFDERLSFIDISQWQNTPAPEREWTIQGRIPLSSVTLCAGEGGVGKTLLMLHCGAAIALGRDWLGALPEPGLVLGLFCEDDEHELHRRLDRIVDHYGETHTELAKNFHALSLVGRDAVMAAPNKNGIIEPTALFNQMREAACDLQPRLIIIDNSADVYAGNENDRAQVRQFVTLLRSMAVAANSGLVLTSHPSIAGINSGSGTSGSTGWHNSARARMYFKRAVTEKDEEPDPLLRVLQTMKSNYSSGEGETIQLRWKDGLFLPVAGMNSMERLAIEHRAEELFLTLLDRCNGQGRNVSDKHNAPIYAPTVFAKEAEAKDSTVRKSDLEAAMRRLFAANKIRLEPYGSPSRGTSRMVRQ
jgi:RecA-family ATPase